MTTRTNDLIQNQKRKIQHKTDLLLAAIFTILTLAFIASTAHAESFIDPVHQTYYFTEADNIGGLQLARVYSSATTFRGAFGTGWCSELDANIQIYAAGESRLRLCDLQTATAISLSFESANIEKSSSGFRYRRDDGAILNFNKAGYLAQILRQNIAISIARDRTNRPVELVVSSAEGQWRSQVEVEGSGSAEARDLLIAAIGRVRFQYSDGLLVRSAQSRFSYNDSLNMRLWIGNGQRETIRYDDREDRMVQIERSTAFGRHRLLLTLARWGKSTGEGSLVDIRAEVDSELKNKERGAEMHPVRILYDRRTRRVSLEGDRSLANFILSWIRS